MPEVFDVNARPVKKSATRSRRDRVACEDWATDPGAHDFGRAGLRSARPVYCRAQDAETSTNFSRAMGQAAWDQFGNGRRLLPASALFPGRSGVDASDHACQHLGIPSTAGSRMLRGLLRQEGSIVRAACMSPRVGLNEADGDDGALSSRPTIVIAPATGRWPPDLPLSVKEGGFWAMPPSSRIGGLCIWWRSSTGSAARCSRGGFDYDWRRRRAWRR